MGPSGTGQDDAAQAHHGADRRRSWRGAGAREDLAALSRSEIYALRKRMGMLFQNGALLTDMDVFENVAFPVREHTNLRKR